MHVHITAVRAVFHNAVCLLLEVLSREFAEFRSHKQLENSRHKSRPDTFSGAILLLYVKTFVTECYHVCLLNC